MSRVRPRNAASLLVIRRDGRRPRVLMGRRAIGHDFMPGMYVFPGGQVDRADAGAETVSELRPEVEHRLRLRCSARLARGLGVAAIRETFEETGILFGVMRGGRPRPALHVLDYVGRAITPAGAPKRFHARFFSAHMEDAATGVSGGSGELLDLRWYAFDEVLELPIIHVTAGMLREVARRLASPGAPPRFPFFHFQGPRAIEDHE